MSAHTKGPWWIEDVIETAEIEVKSDGGGMVCLVTHECVKPDEENEANAHLIASAPELYEAIYTALPYIEMAELDDGYKTGAVAKVVKEIKAAIAKAEGKT